MSTYTYGQREPIEVDRTLLADVYMHWRDGFDNWISKYSGYPHEDVRKRFDDMIECCRRKDGYALWLIPSMSARVTKETKAAAT